MTAPRICYVVNAVGESSVPADIATAVAKHTDATVDVLAWFDAEPFDGDDVVGVTCLNAPDTTLGIDRATYSRTSEILSEYDLVQAHHNHSGSFAKVIARRHGIPSVSREGNMRKGFNRLGRIANGMTNPLADRVVCNSRAVYESFTRWEDALLPEERVVFIPNGVDFDRLEEGRQSDWSVHEAVDIAPDAVVVGTAGMLTEQKDHATLLRAIDRARSSLDAPLELVVAGDGSKRSKLERLAIELEIEDSVHFLGFCERRRVYAMLFDIDVYAMPSLWEGFSAAAVEALAAGNAAVFSDIPPFREPYAEVALFHDVADAESLADHLQALASDEAERERLGRAAKSLVEERYAMGQVAHQYRDLYGDVLSAH